MRELRPRHLLFPSVKEAEVTKLVTRKEVEMGKSHLTSVLPLSLFYMAL